VKKRKIFLRRAAQADLVEASSWYQAINPILSNRLLIEMRTASERIAERPLSFPIFLGATRRMHLKVFPYYVYFRLERSSIVIHGILHTRRDPKFHRKRAE
jgi:toxin ParE1/3/4